jgi:CRISPR/Cas system CSM-associated protein Csm3 (group 7 of RAMP superfamily)
MQLPEFEDKRKRIVADLKLHIDGSLLIRSAPAAADAPDVVHLHSADRPVLPGTSLAGTLRSHALRIARLVRGNAGNQVVNGLFGPRLKGTESPDFTPAASKIRISESFIEDTNERKQTRIAVDRFTGGVVKGALFDEEILGKGGVRIRIEVRTPTEKEVGLLVLLIRDLLSGEIPVGGGASVGRGVLKGTGEILFPDGQEITIEENLRVNDGDREILDGKIRAFAQGGNG